MRFSGCPAKRLRKMSDQATRKPQLDGRSGAIATPACVKAPDPFAVRAELRPARAAERQHGRIGSIATAPSGASNASRPASSHPIQRCRRVKCTPRASSRRSHARNSGDAFIALRKHPSARADEGRLTERLAPGPQGVGRKRLDGGAQVAARLAIAREERSSGSLCVRLSPPRPAIRNLRPADAMRS